MEKARQLRDIWEAQVASEKGDSVQLDVMSGLNNMTLDVIGLAGKHETEMPHIGVAHCWHISPGFNYEFHSLNPENKLNELRLAFDDMLRAVSGEGLSMLSTLQNYFPMLRIIVGSPPLATLRMCSRSAHTSPLGHVAQ